MDTEPPAEASDVKSKQLTWVQDLLGSDALGYDDISEGFVLLQVLSLISPGSTDLAWYASPAAFTCDDLRSHIYTDLATALAHTAIPIAEGTLARARVGDGEACDAVLDELKERYEQRASGLRQEVQPRGDAQCARQPEGITNEYDGGWYEVAEQSFKPAVRWMLLYLTHHNDESSVSNTEITTLLTALSQTTTNFIPRAALLPPLCSGSLYTALSSHIFNSSSNTTTHPPNPHAYLDHLTLHGYLKFKSSLTDSIRDMIADDTPFYESIHCNLLEAFMKASCRMWGVGNVVDHIRQHFPAYSIATLYPYDLEDALVIWANQCLSLLRTHAETPSQPHHLQHHHSMGDLSEIDDFGTGFSCGRVLTFLSTLYFPTAAAASPIHHAPTQQTRVENWRAVTDLWRGINNDSTTPHSVDIVWCATELAAPTLAAASSAGAVRSLYLAIVASVFGTCCAAGKPDGARAVTLLRAGLQTSRGEGATKKRKGGMKKEKRKSTEGGRVHKGGNERGRMENADVRSEPDVSTPIQDKVQTIAMPVPPPADPTPPPPPPPQPAIPHQSESQPPGATPLTTTHRTTATSNRSPSNADPDLPPRRRATPTRQRGKITPTSSGTVPGDGGENAVETMSIRSDSAPTQDRVPTTTMTVPPPADLPPSIPQPPATPNPESRPSQPPTQPPPPPATPHPTPPATAHPQTETPSSHPTNPTPNIVPPPRTARKLPISATKTTTQTPAHPRVDSPDFGLADMPTLIHHHPRPTPPASARTSHPSPANATRDLNANVNINVTPDATTTHPPVEMTSIFPHTVVPSSSAIQKRTMTRKVHGHVTATTKTAPPPSHIPPTVTVPPHLPTAPSPVLPDGSALPRTRPAPHQHPSRTNENPTEPVREHVSAHSSGESESGDDAGTISAVVDDDGRIVVHRMAMALLLDSEEEGEGDDADGDRAAARLQLARQQRHSAPRHSDLAARQNTTPTLGGTASASPRRSRPASALRSRPASTTSLTSSSIWVAAPRAAHRRPTPVSRPQDGWETDSAADDHTTNRSPADSDMEDDDQAWTTDESGCDENEQRGTPGCVSPPPPPPWERNRAGLAATTTTTSTEDSPAANFISRLRDRHHHIAAPRVGDDGEEDKHKHKHNNKNRIKTKATTPPQPEPDTGKNDHTTPAPPLPASTTPTPPSQIAPAAEDPIPRANANANPRARQPTPGLRLYPLQEQESAHNSDNNSDEDTTTSITVHAHQNPVPTPAGKESAVPPPVQKPVDRMKEIKVGPHTKTRNKK
ncbi:hypothetical protein DFJ77DRAFT_46509 [Powellomyces hirtus]|nr:hypothetical protein DFJ77DRAFT_46509 [Powellomyces hirtus]